MYENCFNKPNLICSFFCYNLKVVRRRLLLLSSDRKCLSAYRYKTKKSHPNYIG